MTVCEGGCGAELAGLAVFCASCARDRVRAGRRRYRLEHIQAPRCWGCGDELPRDAGPGGGPRFCTDCRIVNLGPAPVCRRCSSVIVTPRRGAQAWCSSCIAELGDRRFNKPSGSGRDHSPERRAARLAALGPERRAIWMQGTSRAALVRAELACLVHYCIECGICLETLGEYDKTRPHRCHACAQVRSFLLTGVTRAMEDLERRDREAVARRRDWTVIELYRWPHLERTRSGSEAPEPVHCHTARCPRYALHGSLCPQHAVSQAEALAELARLVVPKPTAIEVLIQRGPRLVCSRPWCRNDAAHLDWLCEAHRGVADRLIAVGADLPSWARQASTSRRVALLRAQGPRLAASAQ